MKFVKILILCICFMYAEAFHNFRMSERKKHYHIDDLKLRLLSDNKKFAKKIKSTVQAGHDNINDIPPYIRKYNKRFKSIYESMHNPYEERMRQYERNFRLEKKKNKNNNDVYGYFETYKKSNDDQYRTTNEIPENDVLSEMIQKSGQHHNKKHKYHHHHHNHNNLLQQHHYHHRHHKIKKLRTKSEAALMQKKLKI